MACIVTSMQPTMQCSDITRPVTQPYDLPLHPSSRPDIAWDGSLKAPFVNGRATLATSDGCAVTNAPSADQLPGTSQTCGYSNCST
eukprot:364367-Chlamydomonas_euryale.AAC.1